LLVIIASLFIASAAFANEHATHQSDGAEQATADEETTENRVDDATINAAISTQLAALLATPANEFTVVVRDGEVRLTGKVNTAEEKAQAEKAAARVPGVRIVTNELEVSPRPGRPDNKRNFDMTPIDLLIPEGGVGY
jgi:osmotically-inducible protein OsmY